VLAFHACHFVISAIRKELFVKRIRWAPLFVACSLSTAVGAAMPAGPDPAPDPMNAAETAALRLMVRRDLLQTALEECGKRFPAGTGRYRDALQRWQAGRTEELNRGAMLFLQGRGDPKAYIAEEMAAIKAWAMRDLGMPMKALPEEAECDRFAAGLPALR
jgi:hypothetical protein